MAEVEAFFICIINISLLIFIWLYTEVGMCFVCHYIKRKKLIRPATVDEFQATAKLIFQ